MSTHTNVRPYISYAPTDGFVCVSDLNKPGSNLLFDVFAESLADATNKLRAAGFIVTEWVIASKIYGRPLLVGRV